MNILYLVNMNENNIKGLFTANHEKIMALKKILKSDDVLNVYSVQFYDTGISRLLKKLKKKKIFVNNGDSFEKDGFIYRKEYLKVDLRNRMIEKKDDDYKKYESFINRHLEEIKNCDCVVAQWGYPHGRLAYHIHKKFGKPYFVQYYGSDIHTNPYKNDNLRKKMVEILDCASNNFFVSNELKKSANGLGWNGDNWSITKNGVNFSKFFDIGEDEKKLIKNKIDAGDKKIIGYVGSLTEVKRSDCLPEIYSLVDKKEKCKYLFVGDGDMRSMIENDVSVYGLDAYFTGNVDIDDVNRYLNVMDIMLLPSRREGFGSVIVEANSLGVLALGSDAGGIPEVLGNENYVVKDGEDFNTRFADKITGFLESGWDRKKLIQRVHDEFDWVKIAQKDLDIIRRKTYHEE